MISNLPEVPPTWIKVRFDEIAENITDRIDKPKESGLEYYIGLEHLDTDQIRIKRFGSKDDVNATKFLCKKGDIIFGKRRSYLRKVAVTDRDAVVSAHSMVIRPKGDLIVPDFLPCFMQSSVFWKTAHAISEGSMSPTIKWKTLAKQEFWIPSVEEQKKISEVLWAIENNLEKNELLLEKICIHKSAFLNVLFTKGISHHTFQETDVGEIPTNWDLVSLSEISEIKYGLGQPPELDENGIPMIRATDIQRGSIILDKAVKVNPNTIPKTKNPYLKWGDIIVVRSGAYTGDLAIYDLNLESAIAGYDLVVSPIVEEIYPIFLAEYLLGDYVQKYFKMQSTRSAQPHLNSGQLGNTLIPKPSISEQTQIVAIITNINKSLLKIEDHANELKRLKKKLTDCFMVSKLRVTVEALQNVQ